MVIMQFNFTLSGKLLVGQNTQHHFYLCFFLHLIPNGHRLFLTGSFGPIISTASPIFAPWILDLFMSRCIQV